MTASRARLSDVKNTLSIQQIEQRIEHIKAELLALGDMRPGSLSKQYNVCGKPGCRCKDPENPKRHGPYYQLSWVRAGKSTSQFIRGPFLEEVQAQLANYKTFRRLTEEWVDIALQAAKMKLAAAKEAAKTASK